MLWRLACCLLLAAAVGMGAEARKLRDLAPIIEAQLKAAEFDASELAYIAARGTSLFIAVANVIEGNSPGRDVKATVDQLTKRASIYMTVAFRLGAAAGKSEENIEKQIQLLRDAYTEEMFAHKQLNNEYFSPAILADLKACKDIDFAMKAMAAEFEKEPPKS